jgi:hypothetical protein
MYGSKRSRHSQSQRKVCKLWSTGSHKKQLWSLPIPRCRNHRKQPKALSSADSYSRPTAVKTSLRAVSCVLLEPITQVIKQLSPDYTLGGLPEGRTGGRECDERVHETQDQYRHDQSMGARGSPMVRISRSHSIARKIREDRGSIPRLGASFCCELQVLRALKLC